MTRKGVLVSINSDSAEHARRLNTEAAKSMQWGGLTEDEALALVTINPAKQLRIDSRVGSLEVGKDADVVVWNAPSAQHLRHRRARLHRRHASTTTARRDERRLTELKKEKSSLAAAERAARARPRPTRTRARATATTRQRRSAAATPTARQASSTARGRRRHRRAPAQAPQPRRRRGRRRSPTRTIHPITAADDRARHDRASAAAKIEALGANVPVPAGAKVVDAAGADVYPGFINARTTIGPGRARRRAASKTSTRCSTSTRSSARASRITPRATRFRSRAPTASRRSRSCPAAASSAARWR